MKPESYAARANRMPTVWVGECICGLLVHEKSDGRRYDNKTRRIHSEGECRARRGLSGDNVVPFSDTRGQ